MAIVIKVNGFLLDKWQFYNYMKLEFKFMDII
jgi:hypothetical protein